MNSCVAAGKHRASKTEARALGKLERMLKRWSLVIEGTLTFDTEHRRVAEPVNAELICVCSVVTAARSEIKRTVSKAICSVHNGFLSRTSSDALGTSAMGLSDPV